MKRPRSHEDSDHSDSTDIQGPSVADLYVMGLYTSGQSIKQPDCTAALTLINLSLSRPGPSAAELHDWFEDLNQGASHDQKALSEAEDDDTEALTPTSRHASESHHHHLLHDHSSAKAQRQHTPSPSPKHAAAAAHAHAAEGIQSCLQCGSTDTPLWRTGPLGPKTLCNACGVKFSRHQQKGKPGVKHHAAKKVKLASPHSPSNSDSPLA